MNILMRRNKALSMEKREKALIVGGSNGIGLGIARELIKRKFQVIILDKVPPEVGVLSEFDYRYYFFDMIDLDEILIQELAKDQSIKFLVITAGFGRVIDFENLHLAEIQGLLQVNTLAVIKIIYYFYHRINGTKSFCCGIMGSIAGLVSSPLFSVYAASKAAICRFVESVNIELELNGTKNRILNISPGSISGTKFKGKDNDLSQIIELANEIIDKMLLGEELFIPQYEQTYKSVIEWYQKDSHAYGIHSYEYKKKSCRIDSKRRIVIGYLSGTFDLFHVGHLNLLRRAKKECDYLIVGVHPDASHKGKQTFIPFEERVEILKCIKYVDKVVQSCPEDSEAWDLWHYDKLFVGSDYIGTERFNYYENYFRDKKVKIIYFPYTEGTSSTQIRKVILDRSKDIKNLSN